jgi:hypothetical protein
MIPSIGPPVLQGATRVDRMRRKLQTKVGAAIYSRRKTVVEPVFGQVKQARGFRQFLWRGLQKVQGEWAATRHLLANKTAASGAPVFIPYARLRAGMLN